MPIQINYNPAAEAIAQVAFRGGLGRFRQAEDQFGLDVARFGEQQRQFNVGTQQRNDLAEFQALVNERSQAFDQIGRERMALFDFAARQELGQQQAAQEFELQQQRNQQRQFDNMAAIQAERQQAMFRDMQAEYAQIADARAKGLIDDDQLTEAIAQHNAKRGNLGIPPVGAEQFGSPPPDPMEIAGQQAAEINERVFRGENIAFVQPDGKIDFLPYQNTPAGIAQEHAAKMEIEDLKQQAAQQKAQSDTQAKQGEAQQKQQQDAEKERQQIEKDRRAANIKAVEAREKWVMDRMGDLPTPGQEDTLRAQWEQEFGEIYRMAPTPPVRNAQGTSQEQTPAPETGQAAIPSLPPFMPPGEQTLEAVMGAYQTDPRFTSVGNDLERQQLLVQRARQLRSWLVDQQLPFINSPEAFWQLPPGTWAVGPDFQPIQAPHRNEQGFIHPTPGTALDAEVAKLQLQMSGLRSAAMGMYDPNSASQRYLLFQTRGMPTYPVPSSATPAAPAQKQTKKTTAKKSAPAEQPFFSHPLQGARRRIEK